jgi:hypothetical protein
MENVRVGATGPLMNCTRGIAVTARSNTKPVPGQPSGNVEKAFAQDVPLLGYR